MEELEWRLDALAFLPAPFLEYRAQVAEPGSDGFKLFLRHRSFLS